LGRVISVSGGRVIVDFNNPVAGKEVEYKLIVKRLVQDIKEKADSLIQSIFNSEIPFKIEQDKIILEINKGFGKLFEPFKPKFKEILNLELETIEKVDKKSQEQEQVKTEDKKE